MGYWDGLGRNSKWASSSDSMEAQAKAQVINHLFGNGFIPPIYGDLGDGLLLFYPHKCGKVNHKAAHNF